MFSGAPEWRGWQGDHLHAMIHTDDDRHEPYVARVTLRVIGRFPTLEAAMLAVQQHDLEEL